MRSIRGYLLSRLIAGLLLVLGAAGVALYFLVAGAFARQFDDDLSARVRALAGMVLLAKVEGKTMVEFEFSDELMPEYSPSDAPEYFQLWLGDGRVIERSESLEALCEEADDEIDLALSHTHFEGGEVGGEVMDVPVVWSAPLPDGRDGRYSAQFLYIAHLFPEPDESDDAPDPARICMVVAHSTRPLLASQRMVLGQMLVTGLLVFILAAALVWNTTRRGLAPANRLARALDAVVVDDPPDGLAIGDMPLELIPMRDTSNALIQRASAALQRERRTTADIAHQLRTPISEILTVSEVALRGGAQNGTATRALGTTRDVAWRMGRSVSTLLQLARLDMGSEGFEDDAVAVGRLVRDQLRSLAALGRERELHIVCAIDDDAVVVGSREVLEIVVGNLLSNALYYAPRGSEVRCSLSVEPTEASLDAAPGAWKLSVENEAPNLAPADLTAMTEAFWRKDRHRTDGDRSGLGLALSTALAERTGTELGFALEGCRLVATLARVAPESAQA